MDKITMKLPMYSHYNKSYHPYQMITSRGYTKEELLRAMLHPRTVEHLTQTGYELQNDLLDDEIVFEPYSLGHIDDISTLDKGYLMVHVYKDKIDRVNYLLQNGWKVGLDMWSYSTLNPTDTMDEHCDWISNLFIRDFRMVDPERVNSCYRKMHLSGSPLLRSLCYVK